MDPELLQPRKQYSYQLRSLLISPSYPLNPFFPPKEFTNPYLRGLRLLPKNLVQLNDRITEWIGRDWMMHEYTGINLEVVYENNLDHYLDNTSKIPVTFFSLIQELRIGSVYLKT